MSHMLLREHPLIVLPSLAVKIGLNEAIVLQQFHYWVDKSNHEIDGKFWIYNTYPEWNKQFPFWSRNTMIRAINNLEKMGLVIVGNHNKMNLDKTKWYTLDYDAINELENPKNDNEEKLPKNEKVSNNSKKKNEKSSHNNNEILIREELDFSNDKNYGGQKVNDTNGLDRVTQNGLFEEPNMSRWTTQNGYMDNPKLVPPITQNGFTNNQRLPETTPETTQRTEEEEERLYLRALFSNPKLKEIAEYLLLCEMDISVVMPIILELKDSPHLCKINLIEAQIRYMASVNEDIYDLRAYFMTGLRRRYEQGTVRDNNTGSGNKASKVKFKYANEWTKNYDFRDLLGE